MTILGNRNSFLEDNFNETNEYDLPSVVKNKEEAVSLKKSIILSSILHPTVAGIIWLIVFVLMLMGISLSIFERPKANMNDIEFVLVDNLPEQMPKNKKTKFRSDRNTRTGGKNNPKKPVSMPSPSPIKKSVQQKSSPAPKSAKKAAPKSAEKSITPKKSLTSAKSTTQTKSNTQPRAGVEPKPAPPSARPSLRPANIPKAAPVPKSSFAVPVPKGGTSKGAYSTGPIGGKGTATKNSGAAGGTGRGYSASPKLGPTGGGSGSTGSKLSGGGSGYGNPGNPGGGGGRPGIDSIREPDFGPYMRDLQRRIKQNWDPPKGNESKRVVLLFKIAKDGRLLSCRVFKSSGLPNADKAALHAVELTAPFKPLPAGFRGSSIDIQFTFDYNVFGASGY